MSTVRDETPGAPATAEFGSVTPDGPSHRYDDDSDALAVTKFSVGRFDNNVYILRSGDEVLIVDGSAGPERVQPEIGDARVAGIVITHGHPDHTQRLDDLWEGLGRPPLYGHPADAYRRAFNGLAFNDLADGDVLRVGDVDVRVMHTPGHTPGSVSLHAANYLFPGDTLFPGGPGNTNGNAELFAQILGSLERLFGLPDTTRVCPGHGLDTFIGRERAYVPVWRARGW